MDPDFQGIPGATTNCTDIRIASNGALNGQTAPPFVINQATSALADLDPVIACHTSRKEAAST